jgi:superoxide dismutase, Fe-Mn family
MRYVLPDLAYDAGQLEPHLNGHIVELHHGKHHAGYVSAANLTLERLEHAREKGDWDAIVGLEKSLAFNLGGHILHSIYWSNLSPEGGGEPSGLLATAVEASFGGFDRRRHAI